MLLEILRDQLGRFHDDQKSLSSSYSCVEKWTLKLEYKKDEFKYIFYV